MSLQPENGVGRLVKAPNKRREELVTIAGDLFFRHGYEGTSVEMIIRAAQLSKGAFYHHFESKEALLQALVEQMVDRALGETSWVLDAPYPSAIERLNAFWGQSRRLKVELAPLVRRSMKAIFRPENLALRHRISILTIARTVPVLARILEEGAVEGVFDTRDPVASAELLLHLGTGVHDVIAWAMAESDGGHAEAASKALERRLQLYETAFNRVLGLDDNTVVIVEPGFARAILSG